MSKQHDPFYGEAPEQIPLPRAPLEWVITQVKHSTLMAVTDPIQVARFQAALKQHYPILNREQGVAFKVSGEAVPETTWRFMDADKNWRVSLHTEFVSLDVKKYTNRDDFMQRLSFVLEKVSEIFSPVQVTRIGVRYLDRIKDEAFLNLNKMICPNLLGFAGTDFFQHVRHSFSEVNLTAAEGNVTLRWGKIPANMVLDPAIPVSFVEDSWIIDIDLADESFHDYVPAKVVDTARSFCSRIYSIFRWSITDDFIKHYGGKL